MPDAAIRILLLEDSDDDAALVERELTRAGLAVVLRRAADRPTYVEALREHHPDLILSDNKLGAFSGGEALTLAADSAPDTPFIFVSGTIGEEAAIEAMRRGATDYVIKDRLARLIPVVQRALREAADRRARAQLEREFLQSQKMESLGRMAGSIAHDFNNLLAVFLASADALDAEPGVPEAAREHTLRVRRAAERGRELTAQLLAFSRREPAAAVAFDLNVRLAEFGKMFGSVLGRRIALRYDYAPGPLPLHGNPGQVEQVVMNLLVNAGDAMPDGGAVTISTGRVGPEDGPPPGIPMIPAGDYARLTVADTGTGMSAEVKARLFEPFFTTKPQGAGTGLGLATVYGIMRQFGGAIHVASEPGRGTVFTLCFPLAPAIRSSGEAAAAPRPVLLVDDESFVRQYTRHLLESAGYEVLEAGSAAETLALLEHEAPRLGALVTDVMMPDTDGATLAGRARALRPGLPVIFLSASPEALAGAVAAVAGAIPLPKPFTRADFIRVVQSVLPPGEAPRPA